MTDDPTTTSDSTVGLGGPGAANISPLSDASTTTPRDNSPAVDPVHEPDADAGDEASEAAAPDREPPNPEPEPLNPAVVMPGSLSIASRLELAIEDRVLLLERELHLLREQFGWPTKEPQ